MTAALKVGDEVTILPPFAESDDYRVQMQRHAWVAEVLPGERYMVRLGAVTPPGARFGPFGAQRLAVGWRDANGRWH